MAAHVVVVSWALQLRQLTLVLLNLVCLQSSFHQELDLLNLQPKPSKVLEIIVNTLDFQAQKT